MMPTIKIVLTLRQAEALRSWLRYLEIAPTDWGENNAAGERACAKVADKIDAAVAIITTTKETKP